MTDTVYPPERRRLLRVLRPGAAMSLGLAVAAALACGSPAALVVEPLRVINWEPTSGASCVAVDSAIHVTFSADIEPGTLNSESFYLLDAAGKVAAAVDYDAPNFTATLLPNQSLTYGRLHTMLASAAITSGERGHLAVDLDASFTTVERSGCQPNVQCQLPSDCPGTQICSNIGTCIDECVTDRDCFQGPCAGGTCG